MSRTITMTKDGGKFYTAQAVSLALTWPVLPVVLLFMILAIINPFWFRESFLQWITETVDTYSRWRNYKVYGIYLGCDPKVWHTLKDSI